MKQIIQAVVILIALTSLTTRAHAAESCSCPSSGLLSASNSSNAVQAVYGNSSATNGFGVYGNASGSGGVGVLAGGNSVGLQASSLNGTGVYASNAANVVGQAAGFFTTSAGSNSTAVAAENGSLGVGIYASSNGGWAGYFSGAVNITGQLTLGGTACMAGCSSDARLKQHIEPLKGALSTLLALKGVTFEWKHPEDLGNHPGMQIGVIAQDVEHVFPQWVRENDKGFKTVDPDTRTTLALTVEGFRELKSENDDLRERVKVLEAGRRPMLSGMIDGGFGVGLGLLLGAGILLLRRKQER